MNAFKYGFMAKCASLNLPLVVAERLFEKVASGNLQQSTQVFEASPTAAGAGIGGTMGAAASPFAGVISALSNQANKGGLARSGLAGIGAGVGSIGGGVLGGAAGGGLGHLLGMKGDGLAGASALGGGLGALSGAYGGHRAGQALGAPEKDKEEDLSLKM